MNDGCVSSTIPYMESFLKDLNVLEDRLGNLRGIMESKADAVTGCVPEKPPTPNQGLTSTQDCLRGLLDERFRSLSALVNKLEDTYQRIATFI